MREYLLPKECNTLKASFHDLNEQGAGNRGLKARFFQDGEGSQGKSTRSSTKDGLLCWKEKYNGCNFKLCRVASRRQR